MKFLINLFFALFGMTGASTNEEFSHEFKWSESSSHFADHLSSTRGPNDFFYLLMGDTQYWFYCTPNNLQCWTATKFCLTIGKTSESCKKKHGNHANMLQEKSLRSLITQMGSRGFRPKGLIIDGDLTNFGHLDEFKMYKSKWSSRIGGIRIFPGLGNHDYANNVDDCVFNSCAHRMLKWFSENVRETLVRPLDLKAEKDTFSKIKHNGSLAYSWDECIGLFPNGSLIPESERKCIHFVQLNNYPTYTRRIEYLFAEWSIQSSLEWLRKDLDANKGKPVVINFHDYDSKFKPTDKIKFKRLLETSGSKILAIFFAHMHLRVGLHPLEYLCIQGRTVPLVYTGSVPANNYMLVEFNPTEQRSLVSAYKFHVNSARKTTVQRTYMPYSSC